jgi:hypothetical protein
MGLDLRCVWLVSASVLPFPAVLGAASADADPPASVRAIVAEATLPNGAALGRPLPLAGHWNTGHYARARGLDPDWQMDRIAEGKHLLPWFQLNAPHWDPIPQKYYEGAIRKAAAWRLPITFVGTQFESMLTADASFFGLPPARNPNVLGPDGRVQKRVSPFGPVEPWRKAGRRWTTMPIVRKLQQWYPSPPRVLFLSNNEHARLRWHQVHESRRYLARYGHDRNDGFKRKVVAEGWIERHRALQAGMREGLTAPAWRKNALFIGYDAFGPPHLGRWGGWAQYSLWTPGRIDPNPLIWDGGSPSYYVHNWNPSTDYTVWSPQVESCNWPFMLAQAWRLNPRFWWEISLWDGHQSRRNDDMRKVYARRGQGYGPVRYRGFVQFGMWLLRPRVVREFRGWTDSVQQMAPYFNQIIRAVDRVHADATLAGFWRRGELVANRARPHPYQHKIPPEHKDADRWFLLDTDQTPKPPLKLDTAIPVFAMALVQGDAPQRRWLLYAHAPLGDRKAVQITVPGHGTVKADVTVGGVFLVVDEARRTVTALPQPPED